MAGQRRILATSVAGLPAALDAAIGRFRATITQDVLGSVRERISAEVTAAVAQNPSGPAHRRADVDLGRTPRREHWVVVDDADADATSSVFATIAPTAPGKADDEPPMDVIDVWAIPAAGTIAFRLTGLTGRLAGGFSIDYLVTKG